ncbi:hypothetical protein OG453_44625 [Streptomyces sp. NBC_01381]|uniref:type II secretion system F family protein n=1 Tax=Streptomyces sp. NBC_01381 TaxID=2903845 RepID=UPI0022558D8B|nr:hypothetical protein [Streptomyces sp. NBC_01381]MCX4673645.1 hypothetical protein [Streptomyces sp. NBC_01381]
MVTSTPALLSGALVGVGVLVVVRALVPARPRLGQVLRRTHQPAAVPTHALPADGGRGAVWAERIGTRLLQTESVASRLPVTDLKLLQMSPAQLLGRCALYALVGLLLPQWFLLLVTLVGAHLPLAVPALASLVIAAFFAFKCIDDVKDKAKARREEYRYTSASLLERISLARSAEAGATEALMRAASFGDGPAAVRIREALDDARLSGISLWTALEQLGDELGVPELSRPAHILALAAEERASVSRTLESQTVAQRKALLSDRKAEANEATEKMVIPALMVGFLMIVFIAAPSFVRIMSI